MDRDIGDRIEKATRDMLGGKSQSLGMASAKSISGYHGVPATASIAKGDAQNGASPDQQDDPVSR